MQAKTSGIILHTLKYSDSSSIVTVYTKEFGRASYMVYGANKKKSKTNALLQPLSLVELEVSHKPTKEINQLKEIRCTHPLNNITNDPIKNPIALFLAETLYRTLHQDEPDEELFSFLSHSIDFLDQCENGIANFHLVFMMKLTRFLGFIPNIEKENTGYFDLLNGVVKPLKPLHTHYIQPELTAEIIRILNTEYDELPNHTLSRKRRIEILEAVIEYYKLHIPNFNGLNSLEILQNLFD